MVLDISEAILTTVEIPHSGYYAYIKRAAEIAEVWIHITTLVVASVGNSLSLFIMCKRSLRGLSSTFYLSAIAIVDTLTVYVHAVPKLGVHYQWHRMGGGTIWTCKWNDFLAFTSSDLASWLVMALTVDRFIAIWFPHLGKSLCTVKRSSVVCLSLALCAIAKNTVIPISSRLSNGCCVYSKDTEYFMSEIRPWMGFTLYLLIPVSSVFILNVLIIYKLVKVSRALTGHQAQSSRSSLSSINAMFITVAVVFLLLKTPAMLHYCTVQYWAKSPRDKAVSKLLTVILEGLSHANHCINFFLYCLSGRRFRRELLSLIGIKKNVVVPVCPTIHPTIHQYWAVNDLPLWISGPMAFTEKHDFGMSLQKTSDSLIGIIKSICHDINNLSSFELSTKNALETQGSRYGRKREKKKNPRHLRKLWLWLNVQHIWMVGEMRVENCSVWGSQMHFQNYLADTFQGSLVIIFCPTKHVPRCPVE